MDADAPRHRRERQALLELLLDQRHRHLQPERRRQRGRASSRGATLPPGRRGSGFRSPDATPRRAGGIRRRGGARDGAGDRAETTPTARAAAPADGRERATPHPCRPPDSARRGRTPRTNAVRSRRGTAASTRRGRSSRRRVIRSARRVERGRTARARAPGGGSAVRARTRLRRASTRRLCASGGRRPDRARRADRPDARPCAGDYSRSTPDPAIPSNREHGRPFQRRSLRRCDNSGMSPRLHRHRDSDARARHRRHHGHLHADPRGHAALAAGRRSRRASTASATATTAACRAVLRIAGACSRFRCSSG